MTQHIQTETDLITSMKSCQDGDTIFQTSPLMDCQQTGLICDKEVTLINLRLRLHYRHYNEVEHLKPYLTITKPGKLINPYVEGIMPDEPTTWQEDGVQLGIRIDIPEIVLFPADGSASEEVGYYEIINPRSYKVNHTAYQITSCYKCYVYGGHCAQSATPKENYGFGHPFWIGGDGNAINQWTYFYGTKFENNRHCIASSKHLNSVHVEGCTFSCGQYSKHILDRHGEGGQGGQNFIVKGCKFVNPNNYAYDFAAHEGTVTFEGCRFARPFGKNGRIGGAVEQTGLCDYVDCGYKNIIT